MLIIAVGVVFVILAPVIPSHYDANVRMTCGGVPFPCRFVLYRVVPAEVPIPYDFYSSVSHSLFGDGFQCSPQMGGCWFDWPSFGAYYWPS